MFLHARFPGEFVCQHFLAEFDKKSTVKNTVEAAEKQLAKRKKPEDHNSSGHGHFDQPPLVGPFDNGSCLRAK